MLNIIDTMKVYSSSSSDSGHGLKLNLTKPVVLVGILYLNDFLLFILFILRYHILLVLGGGAGLSQGNWWLAPLIKK